MSPSEGRNKKSSKMWNALWPWRRSTEVAKSQEWLLFPSRPGSCPWRCHELTANWVLQAAPESGLKVERRKFSSVQLLSHFWLFATPWTAACQPSLSITNCQNLLKLISIESVMPSIRLILVIPFSSCLQSFPALGSFQMSQFFTSGGQSIGVSALASILPMNT